MREKISPYFKNILILCLKVRSWIAAAMDAHLETLASKPVGAIKIQHNNRWGDESIKREPSDECSSIEQPFLKAFSKVNVFKKCV